jgi:DNA repair protein RadA/Sms
MSNLVPLTEIEMVAHPRILTTLEPLDRVTGGGLVQSGSFLISGGPGAGKSTLLSQMLFLARKPDGTPCERLMWATAEETPEHVAMRAQRIATAHPKIRVAREENVDRILAHADRLRPEILVVDSIQTVATADIDSVVGSVLQVKECAIRCDRFAKSTGACVFLICQETKDGQAAGPNALKHLVDALLSLDTSEEFPALRFLRSSKNRFGSTSEVGRFEMRESGLHPVARDAEPSPGSQISDEILPVAQELVYRLLEAGGEIDPDLRDRIDGRLDLNPRGAR